MDIREHELCVLSTIYDCSRTLTAPLEYINFFCKIMPAWSAVTGPGDNFGFFGHDTSHINLYDIIVINDSAHVITTISYSTVV